MCSRKVVMHFYTTPQIWMAKKLFTKSFLLGKSCVKRSIDQFRSVLLLNRSVPFVVFAQLTSNQISVSNKYKTEKYAFENIYLQFFVYDRIISSIFSHFCFKIIKYFFKNILTQFKHLCSYLVRFSS